MTDYARKTSELKQLFEALTVDGQPAPLQVGDTLTETAHKTIRFVQTQLRNGGMPGTPALARFADLCERHVMRPETFMKAFPQDAAVLYQQVFELLSADADDLAEQVRTHGAADGLTESVGTVGKRGSQTLSESIDLSEAQIDKEARVLRNVVLIKAGMSKTRRHYSEEVLRKAAPLFEGARAFDSHKEGERRVGEITGYYTDVRYEKGALRADRHFTNTRAGRDVWEVAQAVASGQAPASLAGLSINARGAGKTKRLADGDAFMVESISDVISVDDVDAASAGGSYIAEARR